MSYRYSASTRGVTLILVAGVLAILAALATGFHALILMQTRSATRYSDSVRAELMARAGLEDAIARLRQQCFEKTEDPTDPWFMVDYMNGARRRISFAAKLDKNFSDDDGDGTADNVEERQMSFSGALGSTASLNSDSYILNVSDAASKININAGDNLAVLLDNLCRIIGPPLVAADQDMLQPRRWFEEGAGAAFDKNAEDTKDAKDVYFRLYNSAGALSTTNTGRPKRRVDGTALYGDGYAIAGYRARYGRFRSLTDVKRALTYVERNGNEDPDEPLEQLEIEVKFAALRDYITLDSWVDTNTVCVGKFEWVNDPNSSGKFDTAIDRDKSWIKDDLIGCYISIMNGHGAGQLRKIIKNGTDWIQTEKEFRIPPGPISSYMIIAKEDALDYDADGFPDTDGDGNLVDDPQIDYAVRPLCIHRAPVNINTASEKVLAAMFLGLNVQHGHPQAIGTDADVNAAATAWYKTPDTLLGLEPYILTTSGLKRVPVNTGKLVLNRPRPWPAADEAKFGYIYNYGVLGAPNFELVAGGELNEAHELAYRIIIARQRSIDPATGKPTTALDPDPITGMERGSFRSWDDFFFRIIQPFENQRLNDPRKAAVAPMLMAHFNSNTDLLKFNPNIEWIDRWGRNFTEMEPVMVFSGGSPAWTADQWARSKPADKPRGSYFIRSLRYRSDEMIDKSDLNRSTTEFSFDSGGIFEIQSIGQVTKRGEVLAERKLEALVKVYEVWRESTQRQFVQGTISNATRAKHNIVGGATSTGFTDAGKPVRDSQNVSTPKALDTLPEPLVPLSYRINNPRNIDVVDTVARDAKGTNKAYDIPDVIANRVLPANYDGQIVLATNTSSYDPNGTDADTFLASFNGDLDTDTCVGNGREQAKTPKDIKYRVVDTIGLLGYLNDTEVDLDPDEYNVFVVSAAANAAMKGLPELDTDPVTGAASRNAYWNNLSCRMGDLRPEGVFLGIMGTSAKDATLKYLYGNLRAPDRAATTPKGRLAAGESYQNYDPGNPNGATISMWFKSSWNAQDNREHEFFNGGTLGDTSWARYHQLYKAGRFSFSKPSGVSGGDGSSGTWERNNCLWFGTEDGKTGAAGPDEDDDLMVFVHGGTKNVPIANLPPNNDTESPAYYVQPFRWNFVGAQVQYQNPLTRAQPNTTYPLTRGVWHTNGSADSYLTDVLAQMGRPFIATQRNPEGPNWTVDKDYWMHRQDPFGSTYATVPAMLDGCDLRGQPAAYKWGDGGTSDTAHDGPNVNHRQGCFTINNLNESANPDSWIYRSNPIDGTYAVIDELKLSKKRWTSDRIAAEQTLSRYYLPGTPGNKSDLPTFVSQSLLQSMRGNKAVSSTDIVTVARVSWNVFTPRFMHEYKLPGQYSRNTVVNGSSVSMPFTGPFDYVQYNFDIGYDMNPATNSGVGWKLPARNPFKKELGCERLPPTAGEQSHYSTGVEIELLDDKTPIPGFQQNGASMQATVTFGNPDVINTFVDITQPVQNRVQQKVAVNKLRYLVRFKYPINSAVDPQAGPKPQNVNPALHYMLDTPVFDDISITYFARPRMLSCREVSE